MLSNSGEILNERYGTDFVIQSVCKNRLNSMTSLNKGWRKASHSLLLWKIDMATDTAGRSLRQQSQAEGFCNSVTAGLNAI